MSSEWNWSALLADFDNDGHKIVFITNGFRKYDTDNDIQIELIKIKKQYNGIFPLQLRQEYYDRIPEIKPNNLAFQNNGGHTFKNVSEKWEIDALLISNAKDFANASLGDILGKTSYENASRQIAESFESIILINDNNRYTIKKLPKIVQSFPIHAAIAGDFDSDLITDIYLAGHI